MRIGGNPGLLQAVKVSGGTPGPLAHWFGAWTPKTGFAAIDRAAEEANTLDVPLLAHAWFGGDQLNTAFLHDAAGTWDPYQKVQKTRQQAIAFMTEVGKRTAACKHRPYIVVETEFNKGGIEKDPALVAYLQECFAVIRQGNPRAVIVLSPGDWQDLYALAQTLKPAFDAADALGARTMRCSPRTSPDRIPAAADALLAAAKALRRAYPRKPILGTDFAIGTLGGPVSTSHPFGAIDSPRSPPPAAAFSFNDDRQKATFDRLLFLHDEFVAQGVDTLVVRGYRDAATADVQNYYGFGERTFGIVRGDGTHKPAHPSVLALARKPSPPPASAPNPLQADLDAANARADTLQKERDDARHRLAQVRETLQTVVDGIPNP